MKPIRLFILLGLALVVGDLNGQKPIKVSEDSLSLSNEKVPGLVVTIPEANYERTLKTWIKELERGTKSKVVNENSEMSIFGAIIKSISANPINVYSKLYNHDTILLLGVSFELKKGQYIERPNGDADLTKAMEFLKQFSKSQYIEIVKDELQAEEKKLRELENQLNSLENSKLRMQKSIRSSQASITSEKDNILAQNNELTRLTNEILEQNTQMAVMEEGTAKADKVSFIKDLEKSKKKVLKEIESSENKIAKANSEINDAERDIPRNESEQNTMNSKITEQQTVVQNFTEKLNNVKAY